MKKSVTAALLLLLTVGAFGASQKDYLPRNRQDDGQMLLRYEGRQVLLQTEQEDLRPMLLRHEVTSMRR